MLWGLLHSFFAPLHDSVYMETEFPEGRLDKLNEAKSTLSLYGASDLAFVPLVQLRIRCEA